MRHFGGFDSKILAIGPRGTQGEVVDQVMKRFSSRKADGICNAVAHDVSGVQQPGAPRTHPHLEELASDLLVARG